MQYANNICDKLLLMGYSKQELDLALHKFVLWERMEAKRCLKGTSTLSSYPLTPLAKNRNKRKHVVGQALSLLKTQFAKKPKNPV